MPKTSARRWREIDKIQPALDVLNGKYDLWRLRSCAMERGGLRNDDPQPEDSIYEYYELFDQAAGVLRRKLTEWVEEWQSALQTTEVSDSDEPPDPDERMVDYLTARPDLLREFDGIAAKLGIPTDVRSWILTPARWENIGDQEMRGRIQVFLSLLQGGDFEWGARTISFDGGFNITSNLGFPGCFQNVAAEGEAMRLFVLLLQSKIPIGKCSLDGCRRYFLNIGGCRRFCCKGHTQSFVNQKVLRQLKIERDLQKNRKLDRARRAIREYELADPNQDWKAWVGRRAKVSKNFLTLHVRQGGLPVPKPRIGQ